MARKPRFDPAVHDENPEWTAKDFARARSASELPPEVLAQFKNKVGRPPLDSPKVPVKLRLDGVVLEALRATGPGWQTRINDMLKAKISQGKVRFEAPVPTKRKQA